MPQSTYIVRPAETDSVYVGRPSPVGSSVSRWTQLVSVEQASNAIDDPGGYTGVGTSFDGDLFTWTMNGDIVQILGYQHEWAGWSIPLLTLYPDFDPDTDEIEVGLEISAMPLSTAKYGLFAGITDRTIATRASIAAAGLVHAFPNSATATNGGIVGATSLGSDGSNAALAASSVAVTAVRGRIRWLDQASPSVRVTGDCSRSAGGDAALTGVGSSGPAFDGTLANWRLVVGHLHVAAVSGTPTLAARVYHRRLRTAGVPFP